MFWRPFIPFQFDKDEGARFKTGCALYCQNQSYALDHLRARSRKDSKLANFLNVSFQITLNIYFLLHVFVPYFDFVCLNLKID